ncbi:2-oxoacid:acceptor oxidoreductase subunit alpha [bacterium]|nr:2-oxoacid:acceptor oxidoreductase subunit alpha [bacterium]
MDTNIRIAGEAGQGVQTAGDLLVEAFSAMGLHLLSSQSYMSRVRGGLNWFDVRIGDREVLAPREDVDLLIALHEDALTHLRDTVNPDGLIVYDGEAEGTVALHFDGVAQEVGGQVIMANAVAAGAVFGVLGYDVAELVDYLGSVFAKKGAEVVAANAACARRGAELMAAHAGRLQGPAPGSGPRTSVDGARAVALGACTAGLKLAAAYPMSPSTAVLNAIAGYSEQFGILVEQAEDEIAAINIICGATYAGAPAMLTTSGGGFALMAEGLSLAGMLELPAVILLAMRPGPATGLPTRTGQEDLRFVISAGHGEFPRFVFAPGDVTQAYALTRHALAVAHEYQTPAFILTDQYLVDLHATCAPLEAAPRPIDRGLVAAGADYVRYALTDSGISPRAIPGGDAIVMADSDEHTEDGHVTEDLSVRVQMVDKRLRKEAGMCAAALPPTAYRAEDADTLLVCWGSTYGACREAVDLLRDDGRGTSPRPTVGMLHFGQVWPLNADAVRAAIGRRERVVVIEGNARGQFASVLREIGALTDCETMAKYDGLPFTAREIVRRLSHE